MSYKNSASASEQASKTSETNAKTYADNASASATGASTSASEASKSKTSSSASASQAKTSEINAKASETNSAKSESEAQKYAEQAKEISESLSGALRPLGTINFANLPSTADASSGDMYNITDQFTTNDDFKEGAGNIIPAGSNVYLTIDRYWDVLAGTPVTGVKGNSESSYRRGNVNITPANIGALSTTGEASNTTVKFTESTSRTKPTTGEKISSIVGKIVKFLSDLKTVAFTGSYNDLSNKPLSLPANGGNASTVNGHTVNADVPSGALRPLGTINFANLPSTADASSGDMYNITDQFTTNDDFKEGAGNIIPAGSNVYLTIDRYWDVLAGTPVTGVKGNSESSYRRGNVNITPANIGALSTTGEASNTTVKFTESTSRTKPTTGEKISSIVGKIVKFLSDLKTVAFTGSYNDLSNKPLSLPANGGNASTVNGHTVNADVPSGAKFTDTHVTVADNLTSTSTTNALSANQGRILKNGLDEVNQSLAWIALPVNKNFIYNISEAYHEIWISFRIQYTLEAARPYIARDLYISTGERQGVVRIYTDSYYFDEGNRVTWGIQYDPINRKISVPENWINAYYNGVEFSPDKILHVRVR